MSSTVSISTPLTIIIMSSSYIRAWTNKREYRRHPTLVIFNGKSGILQLISEYVGNPTAQDLLTFRQLIHLLPVFIEDAPFTPTEEEETDEEEEKEEEGDYYWKYSVIIYDGATTISFIKQLLWFLLLRMKQNFTKSRNGEIWNIFVWNRNKDTLSTLCSFYFVSCFDHIRPSI